MAAENGGKPRKFKPNPMRQVVLVALALVGLAIGYGLGYLFKPDEQTESRAPQETAQDPAPTSKPATTPASREATEDKRTAKLALPPPNTVLPENLPPTTNGPVRAYEEPLPKEIVVTVERIGPQPGPDASKPAPAAGAPLPPPPADDTPKPAGTAAVNPATVKTWQRHAVPTTPDGRPMIAIVFDDLGIDKPRTKRTISLPGPMSMSFLTYATRLGEQTALARAAGHEIWMHVPMEPRSRSIDPGPQVLLTGLPERELAKNLMWSLDRFDNYVGINNHMGSRFTSDLSGMTFVMEELHRRGLAFLDSVTSGRSQGQRAAKAAGVDYAVRNIFIDHQDDIPIIKRQLAAIETLAKKQGHAIAIGHPREKTLKAMEPWLTSLNSKGFRLVPVSALLSRADRDASN